MEKVRFGIPGVHHVRGYYDGYSFIYRDRLYALTQWDQEHPWKLIKLDGSKEVINTHRLHLDSAIEALDELLRPFSSPEPFSPAGATTPRGEAGVDEVDPSVPPWD